MDAIELALFASRAQAVCDEMGVVLRRTAFSPNIKDRLDFSCALFDAEGALFAQAAHIPVHLGSMAYAMADVVARIHWRRGDVVMFNDPFLGGTHLPDVTVVMPVWADEVLIAFAATRAHHADIGADAPGSMPLSRSLEEEGVIIEPMHLLRDGRVPDAAAAVLARLAGRRPSREAASLAEWQSLPALADFAAQVSSAATGARGVEALAGQCGGAVAFHEAVAALDAYAERMARAAFTAIPAGVWVGEDLLDDDGQGNRDLRIVVRVDVARDGSVDVDFTGTAAQSEGNLNCPLSVAAAAVLYVFRCLMPAGAPASAGAFRPVRIRAPEGSLLNATRPAAVSAGNVETSMRIVDVLLRALAPALPERIPAAAQGTMNNVAMGARGVHRWDYYETLAGGLGAHAHGAGPSARHAHMTNTLNTPIESLEAHYPLRVERYALRRGSGGRGLHAGGDGVERHYRFLEAAEVTLLAERRVRGPWGLAGGGDGAAGADRLNGRAIAGKSRFRVAAGDLLEVATPGGGAWGAADPDAGGAAVAVADGPVPKA
ncbi:MAG TPA: hydantoinase B/oxoprolinase family protein [Pseudomonadales bacterium]|nr:hydantoinase B/oxoprolinase family protein [Pseudomonadales bacterium]